MYLSKIQLNAYHPDVRRDLSNAYHLHRTLCRVYAEPNTQAPRFLWRMINPQTGLILAQSPVEPKWEVLPRQYLAEENTKNPIVEWKTTEKLWFSLCANPTVTRKTKPEDRQGKRHGVYEPAEQLEWLHRQAERCGFEVVTARVLESKREKYYKAKIKRDVVLGVAHFEGYLRIADLTLFTQCMEQGVGHGRAFGLGMLMLTKPEVIEGRSSIVL